MNGTPNPVKQKWLDLLLADFPPEAKVRCRNAEITRAYALWYEQYKPLYKWAGCAAFASQRVGLALMPYQLLVTDGVLHGVADAYGEAEEHLLGDLDLLRRTNTEVFLDIGWAHLAYVDPKGGLSTVEAGLDGSPQHEQMLQGFRRIDEGRRLLDTDPHRANELVWEGNKMLLHHEQGVIIQHFLRQMRPEFSFFLSAMTELDFDANNLRVDATNTSFSWTLWTKGLRLLMQTMSLPDFCNFQHRWFWIENGVLPTWRTVDETDSTLARKLGVLKLGCNAL